MFLLCLVIQKLFFLFWLFSGWVLNHLGMVCKSCGAAFIGCFFHICGAKV